MMPMHEETNVPSTQMADAVSQVEETGGQARQTSDTDTRKVRLRMWKSAAVALAIGAVGMLAVVTAMVVYGPSARHASNSIDHGAELSTKSLRNGEDDSQFLSLTNTQDGVMFVLDKAFLGQSFLVYPTVDKKSSPMTAGLEHGSFIVETDDYVFHFELSEDPFSLLLVREDHKRRWADESLRQAFENNQWPGHVSRIFDVTESEQSLVFAPDALTSNGFFVVAPEDMEVVLLPSQSVFYEQNANVFVEYSNQDMNLVVMFSIAKLPEKPMAPRIADDRIGYFQVDYVQYGASSTITDEEDPDGLLYMSKMVQLIHRRRLESDKHGNTVNPITFHIDPSVPEQWRSAFATGVEAWGTAFEKAGFKNAIRALVPGDAEWPQDYRIGDLRYDSISVMLSESTYAVGPSVVDPRSGEILHSDILFEYGFFDSAIQDFTVFSPIPSPQVKHAVSQDRFSPAKEPSGLVPSSQRRRTHTCGLAQSTRHRVDNAITQMFVKDHLLAHVKANNQQHDDETHRVLTQLALSHLSDVVMHEVGHVLGLRHNFAGSSAMTLDQLNQPKHEDPATNADESILSSSIMDYLPANIWSNLTVSETHNHQFYMSKPGRYDEIAIQYGYQVIKDEVPGHQHRLLTQLATGAPLFLTDEDQELGSNPLATQFDLANEPLKYFQDQLQLVQLLRKSSADSVRDGESWMKLWRRENALLHLTNNTAGAIAEFIGGVYTTHAHKQPHEATYKPQFVSRSDQLQALKLLSRIISGEPGLFPPADQYASFLGVGNPEERDALGCGQPSIEYACLGRSLAQVDSMVLSIRINALVAGLVQPLQRIVSVEEQSPVTMEEVVKKLSAAATKNPDDPRNQVVNAAFQQIVEFFLMDPSTDPRIAEVFKSFQPSPMSLFDGN